MKTEWLITDETYVGSPPRAEHDILGMVFVVFWPVQATLCGRGATL